MSLSGCGSEEPAGTPSGEPARGTSGSEMAGANPAQEATNEVTADLMRGYVIELSDDKYEGRGPGSAGDEAARAYLVSELKKLGLEPGGPNGSWEQPFDLIGVTTEPPDQWTFRHDEVEETWKQCEQLIVYSEVQQQEAGIEDAEVLCVDEGMQAPEYEWDDFKGQDLTGKVLVVLNNDPAWEPDLFAGESRRRYGRWDH